MEFTRKNVGIFRFRTDVFMHQKMGTYRKIADFGGDETGDFTKKNGDLTQNRYLNGVNMT